MDRMTSFEGDTGPYLQYAHARLTSILRKATDSADADAAAAGQMASLLAADLSLLAEPAAVLLARSLAQWPDVFLNALRTQEPITVLTYLFKMTHCLSSSYDGLRIVGRDEDVARARLALYVAARVVLANGMRLLGLTPLERM